MNFLLFVIGMLFAFGTLGLATVGASPLFVLPALLASLAFMAMSVTSLLTGRRLLSMFALVSMLAFSAACATSLDVSGDGFKVASAIGNGEAGSRCIPEDGPADECQRAKGGEFSQGFAGVLGRIVEKVGGFFGIAPQPAPPAEVPTE